MDVLIIPYEWQWPDLSICHQCLWQPIGREQVCNTKDLREPQFREDKIGLTIYSIWNTRYNSRISREFVLGVARAYNFEAQTLSIVLWKYVSQIFIVGIIWHTFTIFIEGLFHKPSHLIPCCCPSTPKNPSYMKLFHLFCLFYKRGNWALESVETKIFRH